MIRVHFNSTRHVGPVDRLGTTSTETRATPEPAFSGDAQSAAQYLRECPLGMSVEVRHPRGARSCMNKPALWEWVEELDQ